MQFNFKSIDRHLFACVVVVWIGVVALSAGALTAFVTANRISDQVRGGGAAIASARLERTVSPLAPEEVAAIAKQIAGGHPSVKVEVQSNVLRLSIASPLAYSEFRAAIADMMQAGSADVMFETVAICGTNCDSSYFVAEFAPKRGRYVVT